MTACVDPNCSYGQGTITWHVTVTDGRTVAVERPDRGDASPVDVWLDGQLVPGRAQHVAVGGHCWSASPCSCVGVVQERRPVYRRHLSVVAA